MIAEKLKYQTHWTIRKYASDADFEAGKHFHVAEIDGNILLNEGIGALLDLLCGLGSPTAFSNANAYIGVGDSSTAESAAHTGLQASTNKLYKAMQASYPSRSGQTVTFRAVFTSAEANWAWNEFTVSNGSSDASVNLNRKVSAQGTKASGQTWTVDVSITLA
jgi:hypothetical protein